MRRQTIAIATALTVVLLAAAAAAKGQGPQKRAITFEDLISMHRVSGPQISPDGRWIAYEVATPDLAANRAVRDIWIVPAAGGEARRLTSGGSDTRPRWSPDGKKLAFLSSRDGTPQVFVITPEGGDASRLTPLSTGADNEVWSPDGKSIAFTSSVFPDCKDDACNAARDAAEAKNKVKAHVYEELFFRHWNAWWDHKRSHLFVVAAMGGAPRDLTPGADYDVPPFSMGEPDAIAFSPDGQELCFTANTDKDAALSTNGDLFTVPASGAGAPKRITTNPGNDWGGVYSPDGKWIAYRAQLQAGYESDRWRLMLYDRASGKSANLTENFDRSVAAFAWMPDSKSFLFEAENEADVTFYTLAAAPGNAPKAIAGSGHSEDFDVSKDGRMVAFARSNQAMPSEVFVANADGSNVRQVTHQNSEHLAKLDLAPAERFWFEGAAKTQVEALLVRPPNSDATKKYPLLLLVHGGPQNMWADGWSYRWNSQLMAAAGYVALMINPHGSTGYGPKFTAEISRDWGGEVYEDLMKGVDAAITKYPFIDGARVAAAGGSYGGYMVDWMATHTDRFKCLISHAGPYNLTSMYATEELWFPDWEYGGPPWAKTPDYNKWSPDEFAGALGKFKTPTLVIGGELDFRVPYTQSLEFFTALQRQGVPSKLVIYPDEGHWILKPQNSQFWYATFLDWLRKYLK